MNRIKPTLAAEHGPKITSAIAKAVYHHCKDAAYVDGNGNVDIDIGQVIDRATNDAELRGEIRTAIYRALPYVADKVTCEKRQKWSKEREHERRLARAI